MIALLLAVSANAEISTNYYSRNDFLMTSAGTFQEGLLGFSNPANLGLLKSSESRFYWSSDGVKAVSFGNWGFFFGGPNLGFGVQRQEFGDFHVTDYRLSLGFGSDMGTMGIGYGWSSGDKALFNRERILSVGTIMRPFDFLSFGLLGNFSMQSRWNEGMAELGVRPLGTPRLTLFADAALEHGMRVEDVPWTCGTVVEIVEGINLTGRYFDSKAFTVGLTIDFGTGGLGGQTHYDKNSNLTHYTYYVRAGEMRPSIFPPMVDKNKRYLPLNLKGRIDYQKYVLFDNKTRRFMDILQDIKAATNDPRLAAIVLNLSGMRILPENAWEIREQLKQAQEAGKKVFIFIDNADMTSYHLASVADKIILDPVGSVALFGFTASRTFFKGTLEKLGLGFDEWRFFKYKSADEVFSRDKMSEADYEQRLAYVDDRYDEMRGDVCASRGMTPSDFDELINNQVYFMPEMALEAGLVDTLARWSEKDKVIALFMGRGLRSIGSCQLMDNALASRKWGEKPQIAVIYGLGVCAMDSGIKARWLERVINSVTKNSSIKAVVFRVDSPGGDGMASDLVAEAIKKCAHIKPVIVSQGQVAGSGGYWISMYGDKIIAGPNTVTGSIGVIGGWVYDKGFGEKIGMTSDYVKHGDHADLGVGIRLPFLGLTVPSRNLTTDERAKVEKIIKKFYDVFVNKVAEGRHMTPDEVRKIAQGHFYSGLEGKKLGLVDEIGGMMTALAIARADAGLKPDEEVEIVEIPKYKGLFDFGSRMNPLPISMEGDPAYRYIKMNLEHKGQPLPMLIPGTYPTVE
jgi:protease IV